MKDSYTLELAKLTLIAYKWDIYFFPNGFHNIFMSVVKDHFRSIDLVKIQGNTIRYSIIYFYICVKCGNLLFSLYWWPVVPLLLEKYSLFQCLIVPFKKIFKLATHTCVSLETLPSVCCSYLCPCVDASGLDV